MGNFHVLEYMQDASVSPANATTEYVGNGWLVNVYRGTGKVLMSPVAPTSSLYAATNTIAAKAAAITSNTFGK